VTKHNLELVAEVYSEAVDVNDHPTLSVATTLGVTRTAAAKLVWRARQRGLLSPTRKGHDPTLNRKLIAVADAVGVEPRALHEAIERYANGDLRCRRAVTV